jgi:hypothetical protein
MTAATRMTQTIEACVDPNTQLSFTLAVFLEIKTIKTASSATARQVRGVGVRGGRCLSRFPGDVGTSPGSGSVGLWRLIRST